MHISETSNQSARRVNRRWEGDCNDAQFIELMLVLRTYGGMLPVEGVRAVSALHNPEQSVSQYLAQHKLFFIVWHRQHWMPCFQFTPTTWTPCPTASSLIEKLLPFMSGAQIALWFTRKDRFLQERSPIELLQTDVEKVREYAKISIMCTEKWQTAVR